MCTRLCRGTVPWRIFPQSNHCVHFPKPKQVEKKRGKDQQQQQRKGGKCKNSLNKTEIGSALNWLESTNQQICWIVEMSRFWASIVLAIVGIYEEYESLKAPATAKPAGALEAFEMTLALVPWKHQQCNTFPARLLSTISLAFNLNFDPFF